MKRELKKIQKIYLKYILKFEKSKQIWDIFEFYYTFQFIYFKC